MLGLGNWVDDGKFKLQITQYPLFLLPNCLQLSPFSFFVLVDSPQSWPDSSFLKSFYGILISTCTLFRPVPLFWNSFAFVFLSMGIVQCFIFLGFLSPLENFGLATPIPVDIRVLGVKTPLRA